MSVAERLLELAAEVEADPEKIAGLKYGEVILATDTLRKASATVRAREITSIEVCRNCYCASVQWSSWIDLNGAHIPGYVVDSGDEGPLDRGYCYGCALDAHGYDGGDMRCDTTAPDDPRVWWVEDHADGQDEGCGYCQANEEPTNRWAPPMVCTAHKRIMCKECAEAGTWKPYNEDDYKVKEETA